MVDNFFFLLFIDEFDLLIMKIFVLEDIDPNDGSTIIMLRTKISDIIQYLIEQFDSIHDCNPDLGTYTENNKIHNAKERKILLQLTDIDIKKDYTTHIQKYEFKRLKGFINCDNYRISAHDCI